MALAAGDMQDLLEGTGEWSNTPDIIRQSVRDLHMSLVEERKQRQEMQSQFEVSAGKDCSFIALAGMACFCVSRPFCMLLSSFRH